MKRREMEKSHFCLFMLGMNVCVWFVLFFYLSEGVMVRGCYQGRLDEVWEMVYQSGAEIGKSVATVRHYQNDDGRTNKYCDKLIFSARKSLHFLKYFPRFI